MENEKQILKWFNEELSSEEMEDLKKSKDFDTLAKIAHYTSHLQAPEIDAQEALLNFKKRKTFKKETKVIPLNYKKLLKIAAAVAVLLTSYYFLFFNNNTSYETTIAQTRSFHLPDDSKVVLNAASKITFNKKNWDQKRNLTLVGEAYFEVQKGKTFSVNTVDGVVKVLGTHFNIKQRNNYYEVHCYEGLVSVTYRNNTIKLPPGKTYRVLNTKIVAVEDFNTSIPSWMEQESNFDRIPLIQVIAELERQYDIIIKTEGIDTSKLFTGSFTHTNQKTALEAVTIPLQLSYTIKGKTIIFYKYAVQ